MPTDALCPRCGAAVPGEANETCRACGAALPAPVGGAAAWWLSAPPSPPPAPPKGTDAWWLSGHAPPPQPPPARKAPLPPPPPLFDDALRNEPLAPLPPLSFEPAPLPALAPALSPFAVPQPALPAPPAPLPLSAPRTAPPSFMPLLVLAGGVGALVLLLSVLGVVLIRSLNKGKGPHAVLPPEAPLAPKETEGVPGKGPAKPPPDRGKGPPVETGKVRPPPDVGKLPLRTVEWVLVRDLEVSPRPGEFKAARGLTADVRGTLYASDGPLIYQIEGDRRPAPFLKDTTGCNGLALDAKGGLLACLGKDGRVVRIDVKSREAVEIASGIGTRRFNNPRQLAVDRAGGLYLADGTAFDAPDDKGAVYYVSPAGAVTLLPVALPRPRGLALAPDGRTLYVVGVGTPEVMAYPVESPGTIGAGRTLYKLEGTRPGATGLDVDARGHLYLMSTALPGIVVVTPAGERRTSLRMLEAPVACALGGPGRNTLFVLTRRALTAVAIAVPR